MRISEMIKKWIKDSETKNKSVELFRSHNHNKANLPANSQVNAGTSNLNKESKE